jgi:beta-xylosidase
LPFKGQWYLFYHHNDLSPQFDKNRSIRIDSLTFNADGTIRKVIPTLRGVGLTNAYKPIQIDRYSRISGTGVAIDFLDTLNRFAGWKTIFSSTDGWLQYNSVDFENREVSSVEVRAASTTGGTLQVRTDKADGPVIAEIPVAAGAEWKIHQAPVKKQQKNIHHLFITWKGQGNAEVDWIRMVTAQQPTDSSAYYNSVKTYVNPVLPGDHPDPTMLKVGNDFYHCGSSFHFTPYLPVYHSTDMVHWEVISRVVSPIGSDFVTDRPSGGIWQGAITYFYGSYWVYFSANGQWFSKATSPKGPWSAPVQVKTNPITGNLGYDNSIFVDDNGKPYMVIKNGQKVNRIQALGTDGQLTDTVINLDWINAKLQYSWAEGPVMSKRNGYYFYFPAGDVSGGQYVLRTKELTSDSTKWERLGNFFQPITDTAVPFHSPNHISAPLQLADGSWWTLGQSYERHGNDDWSGMGRQTALYPVIWEGNRPWGMAPTTAPIAIPATLPDSGIPWRSVSSDDFDNSNPGLWWHFLSKKAATRYSLTARKGWLRLQADTAATHIVQKETDHYYTAVTKVELDANNSAAKAGIYLTNGNQHVNIQLYSSYDNGKQIVFRFDTAQRSISNTFGNTVWLKLTREAHLLYAFASGDGRSWTSLGAPISSVNLDKVQPNYNSWVGTSIGLFAEGQPADFDLFTCKDGFTTLPAIGYSNYLGVEKVQKGTGKAVTGTSLYGGWMMISGVELGKNRRPMQVEIQASANNNGNIEIWLDQLGTGKKIAAIPVKTTGNDNWQAFAGKIRQHITGHHDVFIKFPPGTKQDIFIHSIRFIQ